MKRHISFYQKIGAGIIILLLITSFSTQGETLKFGIDPDGNEWFGTIKTTQFNNTDWDTAFSWGDHSLAGYGTGGGGSGDYELTKIMNTNGSNYTATEANLQLAIWDLNSTNGGKVFIPDGNISITKPLNISRSNISLIGNGRETILFTTSDINILELHGAAAFPDDLRGVVVEGIHFKGDASHTSKSGITLARGHHNHIKNCFFSNLYNGMYIGLIDDTDNGWYTYNHFEAISKYAMWFTSRVQESLIHGNTMEGGTTCDAGIFMKGQENVISGNTIEEIGLTSGLGDGIFCGGQQNIVSGNTVRECGRFGIYVSVDTGVGNNTIIGNMVSDMETTNCVYIKGQNHIITGNTLTNPGGSYTVHVDYVAVTSTGEGVIISNNHIGSGSTGAILEDTGNATLVGNTIDNYFEFLTAPGNVNINFTGDLRFYDDAAQMFRFSKSGAWSYIYGGEAANSNLYIQPGNEIATIELYCAGDIRFKKDDQDTDWFRFYEGATNQFFRLGYNDSSTELVGIGGDLYINVTGGKNVYIPALSVSGTGDWETTKIMTSNGDNYTATEANLHTAIDSMNNISGWVELPVCDITLNRPLRLGDGIWLRGQGNSSVLRLADSANCTMIRNCDWDAGNQDIRITDLRLEGNSLGQDEWVASGYWFGGTSYCALPNGIYLVRCNDVQIENVYVNDTHSVAIMPERCQRVTINDCIMTNIGTIYKNSGNSLEHYPAMGVYSLNSTEVSINSCIVNNTYCIGFCIEGQYQTVPKYYTMNNTITGCVVRGAESAYYFEDSANNTMTGCVAHDITYTQVWGGSSAIRIASNTNGIHCSDTVIDLCRQGISTAVGTTNCKFSDIHIKNALAAGAKAVYDAGENHTYDGCIIVDSGAIGIELENGYGTRIINSEIVGSASVGIQVLSTAGYVQINNNKFMENVNHAIQSSSEYIQINDNWFEKNDAYGIHITGEYAQINNNWFIKNNDHAIRVNGDKGGQIMGNYIVHGSGANKDGVYLNAASNWNVTLNQIQGFAYGVEEVGASDYNNILFNFMHDCTNDVTIVGGNSRVNCTGFDDWNFYTGVS